MTILRISDHNYTKYKWIKFCNQKTEDEEWIIKQKPNKTNRNKHRDKICCILLIGDSLLL